MKSTSTTAVVSAERARQSVEYRDFEHFCIFFVVSISVNSDSGRTADVVERVPREERLRREPREEQAPPPRPPFDLVSRNKIWAEACDKEVANLKLNTNFAVGNLKNLVSIAEKPNALQPVTVPTEGEVSEARALLDELCSVKADGLLPCERFDVPKPRPRKWGLSLPS